MTSIVLAPVTESTLWLSQTGANSRQRQSLKNAIPKGHVNYAYMLPSDSLCGLPEQVVDFRALYTTSIEAIKAYFEVTSPTQRYGLTDRGTDALSHHFGDFSRV